MHRANTCLGTSQGVPHYGLIDCKRGREAQDLIIQNRECKGIQRHLIGMSQMNGLYGIIEELGPKAERSKKR